MNTRIRTVRDQEHVDRLVDDFIIMGYTISEQKKKSVKLIDKKYGSIGTHILIFIFFFWTLEREAVFLLSFHLCSVPSML